jgi:hypothetical protein
LIERRFKLKPLAERDRDANDMLECFDFWQEPVKAEVITRDTKLDFSEMHPTMP